MPSPSTHRTSLPILTNLNSLLTIIWTFFLITPNLTSAIIPPSCASTCYLNAFDTEYSKCYAINTSCFCTILESTGYLTCIEDDCDSASLQLAEEYGAEYCGAGYSSLVGGGAAASTTATAFAQGVSSAAAPSTAVTSIAPAINTNPIEATTAPAEATSTSSAAAFAAATNTFDNFDIPTSTTALFPTLTPTPTPTTIIIQQNPSDSYSGNSGGLSKHAKAGIGAGAGVGGSALLALVGVVAWKFGQRNKHKQEEEKIAAGRAMAAAAAAGNNGGGGGVVSGGVNYVPKPSGGEEAAWTKIEATATESELDGGGHGHEERGHDGHVQDTML
ncbi:hypothetical protein JMJ35_004965 [Cladonia borealis]|uniref:CFEM domain-containing protein n=1 Tax=Cladonia borealis TaxID=184061 RepID=A0AA39R435_9LECA|nr:hypothetical protein JMJ35_004965 [Cladonia borealis]